ncbi:DUF3168 domain-containing protein [Novosphingobium sp. YJ-S2-02]|uniref:DUF3168 domain-containing protein n=1 Tax=Novosphingobium aureum TaxID=2792964 RepID=A0A931HBE1_9SPHN|nr:DUF3168 domain-containing protein [Novosphingobium aureum]MBH0112712.1 DUF3168 domain-containing protein [Novosphingobium aureum]
MASDLARETERAAIIALKADAPLAQIVAKASIDPVSEDPAWPFIRLEGTQAQLRGRGCTARSEVTFQLHSFAKPVYDEGGGMTRTAKDHCADLQSALVEAVHAHAFTVAGRRYSFAVRSTRLMQDGAERDAFHGIASVVARAYTG